ncbi:MAG: hypothetical protein ABIH24_07970 [Verrucomicrobiota bacterium]
MKLARYDQYKPEDTARAESALLTVWAALGNLIQDLVLVGGLVPRYICKPQTSDVTAVTMDVDLGVSLELSTGQYEPTTRRLADHGFRWKDKRFVKTIRNVDLYLDFLTDKPTEEAADSVVVDDVAGVSAVFGVSRALEIYRVVTITGMDLQGAKVTEQVKVCEVGPFICLKLQAYAGRAQGKDVFDLVRAVRDYDRGMETAVNLFHVEKGKNLAYEPALRVLQERFADARSKGPIQYADFCMSGDVDVSESQRRLRNERVNEALDAARLLHNTGANP